MNSTCQSQQEHRPARPGAVGGANPGPPFWRAPLSILAVLILLLLLALLTGCVTTTTTTRTTDAKGGMVEIITITKAADPTALHLASALAGAYVPPRARLIRQEKSATPADLRRILRGRPITRREIAHRSTPCPREP